MNSLDKLCWKLNNELNGINEDTSEEDLRSKFSRFANLINDGDIIGSILLLNTKERLLHPLVVKLATNRTLYYEYAEQFTNMDYKRYMDFIMSLSNQEKYEYLNKNMSYTAYNNSIESMFMNSIIMSRYNNKICPSFLESTIFKRKADEFRVFCDVLLKKKAFEEKISIKSNPVTLSEHLKQMRTKGNIKMIVKRTASYLKSGGNCNSENTINLYLTSLRLFKFLDFSKETDYEILQSIYHEIGHAKINEQAKIEGLFFDCDIYNQQKNKLFLTDNYKYYMANHDYFENEISADIFGFSQLIEDIEKYSYCDLSGFKAKLKDKILNCKFMRFSNKHDQIDHEFDNLLKNNVDFIKINKWLKYEYNKDGSRKSIPDLLDSKINYIADLDKEIRNERQIQDTDNKTLDYLQYYKKSGQVDKLFCSMIYRKIKEFSPSEFATLIKDYDEIVLKEISTAIKNAEYEVIDEIDFLENNLDIDKNNTNEEAYLNAKLVEIQNYGNILSNNFKQKKR